MIEIKLLLTTPISKSCKNALQWMELKWYMIFDKHGWISQRNKRLEINLIIKCLPAIFCPRCPSQLAEVFSSPIYIQMMQLLISFRPSDAICRYEFKSAMDQVLVCWTTPIHYFKKNKFHFSLRRLCGTNELISFICLPDQKWNKCILFWLIKVWYNDTHRLIHALVMFSLYCW